MLKCQNSINWCIWQKSACHVYYSYLRQVIHSRVTSEVNIAKVQMAAIFSLDSKVWLVNYAIWLHKVSLFVKYSNSFIPAISLSYFSHVYCFVLFILIKANVASSWLELYSKIKTLSAVFFLPFHLYRDFKTNPNVSLLFSCPSMNLLWLTHCLFNFDWQHWVPMTSWWRLS